MPTPLFPKFKKLSISDKKFFQNYVKDYPPYSDFNFVSLYSYDTENDTAWTMLNNNLVIKFRDYITNDEFLTFLGKTKVFQTTKTLINFLRLHNRKEELRLIPETVIKNAEKELFDTYVVQEDVDNNDYILSAKEIRELKGNKFSSHRNVIKRFKTKYPNFKIEILNFANNLVTQEIERLFNLWKNETDKNEADINKEKHAVARLLQEARNFDIHGAGIYVDEKMIAFSIEERVHHNHVISYFGKADRDFLGLYQLIENESAKIHEKHGVEFINFEQDLGLPGLKHSKNLWRPSHFLKKFTIYPKY